MGNESSLVPEIRKRAIKGSGGKPFQGKKPSHVKSTNVKNKQVNTRLKDTGRS